MKWPVSLYILQITLTMFNHIFLLYTTVLHIFSSKKKVALSLMKIPEFINKDYLGRMFLLHQSKAVKQHFLCRLQQLKWTQPVLPTGLASDFPACLTHMTVNCSSWPLMLHQTWASVTSCGKESTVSWEVQPLKLLLSVVCSTNLELMLLVRIEFSSSLYSTISTDEG